jgi:hypothetical protein
MAYASLVGLLVVVGGWLVHDFSRERDRVLAEVSQIALVIL